MDNTTNTELNEEARRWAYIKRTPVSKTSTVIYLLLGNSVRIKVSIRFSICLIR